MRLRVRVARAPATAGLGRGTRPDQHLTRRRHVPPRSKTGRPNIIAQPRRSLPCPIFASKSEAWNVRRSTSSGARSRNARTSVQTAIRSKSSEATPSRTAEPTATTAKVLGSLRLRSRKSSTQSRACRVGQRRMQRSVGARAGTLSTARAGLGRPPRSFRSAPRSRRHRARVLRRRHRTRVCGFRLGR